MAVRQIQSIHIQLAIETTQNGQTDNYALTAQGEAIKIGSQLYIRYQEDTLEQPVKVLVKITADNSLTIRRQVAQQPTTNLKFNQQKDQLVHYSTQYGALDLVTHTKNMRLLISKAPFSGAILLEYSLLSQNNLVGDYKLRLIFKG